MMNRFDIFTASRQPFADRGEPAAFLRAARDRFGVLNLSYWFLGMTHGVTDRISWFSTYDEGYVALYLRDVTPRRDSAFDLCFRNLVPLDWAEVRRQDARVESIHAVAERFGVGRHGISFPIREPGLGDAMFSVNLDCEDSDWCALRAELVNELHLFAHYFHLRMKGLVAVDPPGIGSDLSPREREVLLWSAEGMTARETAKLLRVSESAVNLYSARAMSKLGARTRTQAVAIAVRNALLN